MCKDNDFYVTIEDLNHKTKLQNFQNSGDPDHINSIYRTGPHSSSAHVVDPFTESYISHVNKTFVYGIRNSFGLSIDPNNGAVLDTENGLFF